MTQDKVPVTSKPDEDVLVLPSYEETTAGGTSNYSGSYFGDGGTLTEFCWDDVNIRQAFIRKVYAILVLQLSVTIAIICLFTFCHPVKEFVQSNSVCYWVANVTFFVTYLVLSVFDEVRRRFPWNLILLSIFTLALSLWAGIISSFFDTMSVMACLGITALVCLAITIFSFQTKIDLTSSWGVFIISGIAVCFCGLCVIVLFIGGSWVSTLFAGLGALLYSLFLVYEMQQLTGKRHSIISPEEYILAVLNIYLDIVYILSFFFYLCKRNDPA